MLALVRGSILTCQYLSCCSTENCFPTFSAWTPIIFARARADLEPDSPAVVQAPALRVLAAVALEQVSIKPPDVEPLTGFQKVTVGIYFFLWCVSALILVFGRNELESVGVRRFGCFWLYGYPQPYARVGAS